MGLVLVGSNSSTLKKGKAKKKETRQEKTRRTDPEVVSKNEVTVPSEEILDENNTLRDK